MTLTQNPTGPRLQYVWTKQKPQVDPLVMLDVIESVADRIQVGDESWAKRIEEAGKADGKFHVTFLRWLHRNAPLSTMDPYLVRLIRDAGEPDDAFVDAVLAMTMEVPGFKKSSPIDGLVPWFAKEMNRLYGSHFFRAASGKSRALYERLRTALAKSSVVIEWFEKKKPNLSALDAWELFDAVEAFERDREPETVYEWKDGHKIVKLATRTQIYNEGEELNNCLKKGSSASRRRNRPSGSGRTSSSRTDTTTTRTRKSGCSPKRHNGPTLDGTTGTTSTTPSSGGRTGSRRRRRGSSGGRWPTTTTSAPASGSATDCRFTSQSNSAIEASTRSMFGMRRSTRRTPSTSTAPTMWRGPSRSHVRG